jgi:hypothetical protein
MKIKIIKNHPVGLAKGQICVVDENHGERLISEGYAKKAKANDKDTSVKAVKPELEKLEEKINENKCKGCGDVDEPCEDCNDKK